MPVVDVSDAATSTAFDFLGGGTAADILIVSE